MGDKWTLLIVRDLAGGPRRFVELQRTLPGISTEQLRSRLNRMVADDLLTRRRYREVPPRVDYELTERSRELLPVVAELARWGARWAWGEPHEGERVDIGAILRASSGREIPERLDGTVEFAVSNGGPEPRVYALIARDGHLRYTEQPVEHADARVAGSEHAFVSALAPGHARNGLEIEGDAQAAETLLGLLADSDRPG